MTMQEVAAPPNSLDQAAVKTSQQKNEALRAIAETLIRHEAEIIAANQLDLAEAEKSGLAAPALKRLKFDSAKLSGVVAGSRAWCSCRIRSGQTLSATELDTGLELYKVKLPDWGDRRDFRIAPGCALADFDTLLKSGNAALLKGRVGSPAYEPDSGQSDFSGISVVRHAGRTGCSCLNRVRKSAKC